MNEERLFHESEYVITDDDFKKYKLLVHEIYRNEKLTNHKELEPFRDNIFTLFTIYNLDSMYSEEGAIKFWTTFLDKAVHIAKTLKDYTIDPKIINYVDCLIYDPLVFIEVLATLFVPEIVTNHVVYMNSCRKIIDLFCTHGIAFSKEEYDSGNKELDYYFTYFRSLINTGMDLNDIRNEDRMLAIIFAHLHKKGIVDYSLFDRYLFNKNLYKDLVRMNINITDDTGGFNYENTEKLLENFDFIFNNSNVVIR